MNPIRARRVLASVAIVAALSITSACGSKGGATGSPSTGAARQVSVLPSGVALTGKPGSPAPKRLPHRESLKVGIPSKLELEAPALLAKAKGEFAKENLDVSFVTDTVPNLLTLLGQDRIDLTYAGASGLVFNALRHDVPIRWVSGVASSAPASGLYVSSKFGTSAANFDATKLKGATIAVNPGGLTAPSAYPLYAALKKGGLKAGDVKMKTLNDPGSVAQSLSNGSVDGALTGPPFTSTFKPGSTFLAENAYPRDIQIAGYFATTKLLGQRRDVGVAFFRALERTVNTYLNGDYHKNAGVVKAIAGLLGATPANITVAASVPYDFNVPPHTAAVLQQQYRAVPGTLSYTKPVTTGELVDLSLVIDAAEGK